VIKRTTLLVLGVAFFTFEICGQTFTPFTYSDISGYQANLCLFRGPIAENTHINYFSGGSLLAMYGFWNANMRFFDISQIDQQQYTLQLSPFQENTLILSGLVHPNYFENPSTADSQFGIQLLFTPDVSLPSLFFEAVLLTPEKPTSFIEERSQSAVGEKSVTSNLINIGLVPEPSALSLLAVGLGGLAILGHRRS
jgi:hypothetical protein